MFSFSRLQINSFIDLFNLKKLNTDLCFRNTFEDFIQFLAVEMYMLICLLFSSTIYDTHAKTGQNQLKRAATKSWSF